MKIKQKYINILYLSAMAHYALFGFQNCSNQFSNMQFKPNSDPQSGFGGGTQGTYIEKVDAFSVKSSIPKIDVLVVMDNSGSMNYEMLKMSQRFNAFLQQLNTTDWRVGIITTDVVNNTFNSRGRLIPFDTNAKKYFISSNDSITTANDLFSKTIQMSTGGSGLEQGINASYLAIKNNFDPLSVNYQFIRPDAALSILYVSDADERSDGLNLALENTSENLIQYIKQKFPTKTFNAHSIVVKENDLTCLQSTLTAVDSSNKVISAVNESFGLEYAKLSQLTGGLVGDVCQDDYTVQLSFMGQKTIDQIKEFKLSCNPQDTNNDGQIDIFITNKNTGTNINQFTVSNNVVSFNEMLPIGDYEIRSSCLNEVIANNL